MSGRLFAAAALLPGGWTQDVLIDWDAKGQIVSVAAGAAAPTGVEQAAGPVLPGMPNLHSHAFQRAFAGLTEFRGTSTDTFWSWRDAMYRFAAGISAEQLEAVAHWLYIEMLAAGYTSVCEFHYLHHAPDGSPYPDPARTSRALLRAAGAAGIGITLLPVVYQTSHFGGRPPLREQRRFLNSIDQLHALLAELHPECQGPARRLGLAPHSLRALSPEALQASVAALDAVDPSAPVHIHIAEQQAEVEACLAWSGQRPVAWLLDHLALGPRWCLVHATHMSAPEIRAAAGLGAVAGLCPSTEANLADGLFSFAAWQAEQGRWGIGSDSQVCINAAEELLLLEYGQRLACGERNVAAAPGQPQVAAALTLAAVAGGAQASGRAVGGLAPGQSADLVVLDGSHPVLAGLPAPQAHAAHVFAASRQPTIESVWVAGVRHVQSGRHRDQDTAAHAFVAARRQLLEDGHALAV